ncbi:MAG: sulfite exporter TauE/SafE family protein [Rhodobacteraceae bacterium]|nr:sulfite exporter TauE/SafE family protein [Paracoccaceae bacterium]
MAVGLSKGGLPVIGMLAVPVMALVMPPLTAAGLLLPVYVVSDLIGLIAYRRSFDRRVLAILIPATTIGVGLGWGLAAQVPEWLITGVIGVIGAVFALTLMTRRPSGGDPRPAGWGKGAFWGAITGFTSFVSHAGGPPYQVYVLPLGLAKVVFAGTTTILFAYVNAIKLVPYWALGRLSVGNLQIAAALAVPACLAVVAGVWLVRVLPERLYFRLVTWALLLISLRLVWTALPPFRG